jgi:gpW
VATQQQLDQALAARHALLTGTAKVSVGFRDRKVEYVAADLHRLDAYIAELRQALTPDAAPPRRRNRILYWMPQG